MNENNVPHFSPTPLPTPQNKFTAPKSEGGFLNEMFRFALIVLLIVVPIRMFIAQPFVVSGASMEPTFLDGEYLIVDELSYRFQEPRRGDVIIFKFDGPMGKTYLIKRVIGLPNETVHVKNGIVTITNAENPDGFVLREPYIEQKMERPEDVTLTLQTNQYFVMGDNRPKSADSRMWGALDEKKIVGRPFIRLLPVKKIETLPGKETPETK